MSMKLALKGHSAWVKPGVPVVCSISRPLGPRDLEEGDEEGGGLLQEDFSATITACESYTETDGRYLVWKVTATLTSGEEHFFIRLDETNGPIWVEPTKDMLGSKLYFDKKYTPIDPKTLIPELRSYYKSCYYMARLSFMEPTNV